MSKESTLTAVLLRPRSYADFTIALVGVVGVWGIAVGVAFLALAPLEHSMSLGVSLGAGQTYGFYDNVGRILAKNMPAALFLYSGVATGGASSLIGIALIGSFIGATTAAAAATVGLGPALLSVAAYGPVEILGFLLVAAAGLFPLIVSLRNNGDPKHHRLRTLKSAALGYWDELPRSLVFMVAGLIVLVIASHIEATVITVRGH